MTSRRDFFKIGATVVGAAGISIAIYQHPFFKLHQKENESPEDQFHSNWTQGPGVAKHRYEGVTKVTGGKIYASDFRAKDFLSWPQEEIRVALLKATKVDKVFLKLKMESLPIEARPFQIIFAEDLERSQILSPPFFETKLLVKKGEGADYYGQGLALLYFHADAYAIAKDYLNNPDDLIVYGAENKPKKRPFYVSGKFVKYKENQKILYSAAQNGGDLDLLKLHLPEFQIMQKEMEKYSQKIDQELKNKNWKVWTQTYKTQGIDHAFMESENGLSWYDHSQQKLHMVIGSQSPYADAAHSASLTSNQNCPIKIKSVEVNSCYPGGGFGGKDHSLFSVYLALAAIFAPDKSIRMVNSRYDQFQFGLKRHPSVIKETLAVDENGLFQILKSDLVFNGGGNNNFSWLVPKVGADNAAAGSYFPKAEISYSATATPAVPAGSMRGFGSSQAQFAFASLIDEAAADLHMDPIDLQLKNCFEPNQETILGRLPNDKFQIRTILEKAKQHPLWAQRDQIKKNSKFGTLEGVGFALGLKSFGTTRDSALIEISLAKDGSLSLVSNYLDMGNGVATTLPLACARYLGCHASHVKLGATDEFNTLKLVSEFCTTQAQLDKVAANPRFTPEINMSTAASAGAYQQRHAVLQASQILFHKSIIPAAKNLWKNEKIEIEKLKWENGQLNYPGLPSLSFSILVDNIFKQKRIISVMAHCYYQAQWAKATFEFEGSQSSFPIDALAIKYPEKEYQLLNRISVEFPPVNSSWGGEDVFSACGALCHLSVDQKTGNVSVKEFHSFLDCGPPTNKPIVEGQAQGAIVMGIGQTLFEDFPMYEGGPGCGQWNFHKYHVPIANDFPQLQLEVHLIPPLSPNEEPKGIAEVVLNPISPAIANAIAHATGKRFRELPILPQKIVEAMS